MSLIKVNPEISTSLNHVLFMFLGLFGAELEYVFLPLNKDIAFQFSIQKHDLSCILFALCSHAANVKPKRRDLMLRLCMYQK